MARGFIQPWDPAYLPARPGEYNVRAAYDHLAGMRPFMTVLDLAYVLFVWQGAHRLKGWCRDSRLLRDLSIIWNGFNALTSIYMCVHLLPELAEAFGHGWHYAACRVGNFYTDPRSGHAMYMFCLSKLWELGDTLLLALRGRDPIFLHYFHHTVVVFQVVFTYYTAGSLARLGTNMNAFVHSLMYSYFALVNMAPALRAFAQIITCLQILQFLVACGGMVTVLWYILQGQPCDVDRVQLPLHFMIYAVFIVLFAQFFQRAYVDKPRKRTPPKPHKPHRA